MKILNITLDNFQGIRHAQFNFDGNGATIFGENATGKTTLANAHCWLLFGNSSTGEKSYSPQTNDSDGKYIHNLEHTAEERIQLDNGRIMKIRKIFKEVYKKKRGSLTEEFDGDTIEYFLDGVPVKEKEYIAAMTEIGGGSPDNLKMLTLPEYFPSEMPWTARRSILLDICGDISENDVIDSTPDLADLTSYLAVPGTSDQRYSIEDYIKIAKSRKTEINALLEKIPARIDEAQLAMPKKPEHDRELYNTTISALHEKITDLEQQKYCVSENGARNIIRKQLNDKDAELSYAKTAYIKKCAEANLEITRKVHSLTDKKDELEFDIKGRKRNFAELAREIPKLIERRGLLIKEYNDTASKQWNSDSEICPTCGRAYDVSDIQKMRNNFNVQKSKKLEDINLRGKEVSSEVIIDMQQRLTSFNEEIAMLENSASKFDEQIAEIKSKSKVLPCFEETDQYIKLCSEITALKQSLSSEDSASDESTRINNEISDLRERIRRYESDLNDFAKIETQEKRIAELSAQGKELAREFESVEHGTALCEMFIRRKVAMLTDSINSRFDNVRFRLFVEQKNGGLKEDCEVLIPSPDGNLVPYSTANDAAKVNAGLEIISVLSSHFGILLPIFVDNSESVTHVADIGAQTIKLRVSEGDNVLRMVPDTIDLQIGA